MRYTILMRFEVPQFIEIEDKIFGPFTWKQFVYLGGGVGLAVVLFFTTPLIVFMLIGAPIAALAAALAFYPVNNRPFSIFLESVWRFYKTNRMYYWRKKSRPVYKSESRAQPTSQEIPIPTPAINSSSINSLSRRLELKAIQKDEQ